MPTGPGSRLRRLATVAPSFILILAYALRTWRLGEKPIWWDEGLAVWAVRKPFWETTLWTAGDVHPPLFFWSLWPWIRSAGQSPYALRFSVLLCGILLVAIGMALARQLGGRRAALHAGLLLALSPLFVWWSTELRMYMLAALCLLAATLAAIRWFALVSPRDASPLALRWLAAYLLSALAAVHTVYLCGVGIAALNLAMLWAAIRRQLAPLRYLQWLATQVLLVLLFLPWWQLASDRMQSWSSIEAPAAPSFVLELGATLLATGRSTDLALDRPYTLLFWITFLTTALLGRVCTTRFGCARASTPVACAADAAGCSTGRCPVSAPIHAIRLSPNVLAHARSKPFCKRALLLLFRFRPTPSPSPSPPSRSAAQWIGARTLLLFLLLPPLAIWAATQPRSLFYAPDIEARYYLPFAAPVLILAGWLTARLSTSPRRRLGHLALALLILPQLSGLPDHYTPRRLPDDYASMALTIWTQYEPGDLVLLSSGDRYPIFRYHYDRPWDAPAPPSAGWTASPTLPLDGHDRPPVLPFPNRAAEPLPASGWQSRLTDLARHHPRIWLAEVERHHQDPEGRIAAHLSTRFPPPTTYPFGPDRLLLFSRDARPPSLQRLTPRMPGIHPFSPPPPSPYLPWLALPSHSAHPTDTLHLTLFTDSAPSTPPTLELHSPAFPSPLLPLSSAHLIAPGPQAIPFHLPITPRFPSTTYHLTLPSASTTNPSTSTSPAFHIRQTLPPSPAPLTPTDIDLGPLRLTGIQLPPLSSNHTTPLDLHWQLQSPLSPHPTVFVHLLTDPTTPPLLTADAPLSLAPTLPIFPSPTSDSALPSPLPLFDRHLLDLRVLALATDPTNLYLAIGLYDPTTGTRYPLPNTLPADPPPPPWLSLDPTTNRILLAPRPTQ